MSVALARKYRPRNFASLAVQSHVANTLKGAIARDRVAHGYLLCGPRGTGKTTLARVLAMALNCERRGDEALAGEPCGKCTSCQRIWRSEEHTSELQSRQYLVCRLLLEKKKQPRRSSRSTSL